MVNPRDTLIHWKRGIKHIVFIGFVLTNIACDFDISTNSTDEIHGTGGFTFNVADPSGILVDKVEKGADDKTIKLTLNKPLYATSLPTLNYSNSGHITDTVTDDYGIKLNNNFHN